MVETLPDPEAETLHHQTDIEFRFEPVTLRAKGYQPVTAIGQRNNEEIGSQRVRCAYEGTHRPFLAPFCPFFPTLFLLQDPENPALLAYRGPSSFLVISPTFSRIIRRLIHPLCGFSFIIGTRVRGSRPGRPPRRASLYKASVICLVTRTGRLFDISAGNN